MSESYLISISPFPIYLFWSGVIYFLKYGRNFYRHVLYKRGKTHFELTYLYVNVCIENSHILKSRDNNRASADILLLYFYLLFPFLMWYLHCIHRPFLYPDTSVRENVLRFYRCLKVDTDICWQILFCWLWISKCGCNETNLIHNLSLLSHYTSTCFGLISNPSSGGSKVYMWQFVRVVRLSRLSAARRLLTKMYNTYQLSHIYIATSWWWAASKPETGRGIVTQ
jgi:hypothetical protein